MAFDLQGAGPADIYAGGQHYGATWDLTVPTQPLKFVGTDGKEVLLPCGLTWIHLVDPETEVTGSEVGSAYAAGGIFSDGLRATLKNSIRRGPGMEP